YGLGVFLALLQEMMGGQSTTQTVFWLVRLVLDDLYRDAGRCFESVEEALQLRLEKGILSRLDHQDDHFSVRPDEGSGFLGQYLSDRLMQGRIILGRCTLADKDPSERSCNHQDRPHSGQSLLGVIAIHGHLISAPASGI